MKVSNIQLLFEAVSSQSTSEPAGAPQDDSQTKKQHKCHYGLQRGKEFILNKILIPHNSLGKI